MPIRKASNLVASTQVAGGGGGGGGAEVLWEWNGADYTQFGDGAGNSDYDYNSPNGVLSVGAVPTSGIDVPSGDVLLYTTGSTTGAQEFFLINDLPTLPERFIMRARMGPRTTSMPILTFALQDELHHMSLCFTTTLLRFYFGNNSDGFNSGGHVRDVTGVTWCDSGVVVEADCMLIDPDTGVDPQININLRSYGGSGQAYGKGGYAWTNFGSWTAIYHSSWQSGGTIKQPGIGFVSGTASTVTWIGELQILSHPWTNEA